MSSANDFPIDPAAHIEEAIYRLKHSVEYPPECEVHDAQTDLIREVLDECLRPALAELERRENRLTLMSDALQRISTEHQSYEENGSGQYGIGITDGHRCAAITARTALAATVPNETAASLRTLGPLMSVLRKQSKSAALLDSAARSLVDGEPVLATAEEISEALEVKP